MIPNENTAGRRDARRALAESRTARARTARMIEESRDQLSRLAQRSPDDHFTDKLRSIMQGRSNERRD